VTNFHGDETNKKKILKKKIQNGRLKKTEFFNIAKKKLTNSHQKGLGHKMARGTFRDILIKLCS
jgi:hypothetical protein